MKRLFDVFASGCGLLVLSPIFLIMAIWIKLDSEGSVFYRQVRVGRNNNDFRIFKFRSMRVGSDKGSLVTIETLELLVLDILYENISWTSSLN